MLCYKFHPFLRIFTTSCLILFHTLTVLEGSIYYNTQNFIHFQTFLLQITAFGFANTVCSRVHYILCTPPLFQGISLFLRVLSTNYCIFSIFNIPKCPARFLKLHQSFPLCYHAFYLLIHTKQIKRNFFYKTYVQYICF